MRSTKRTKWKIPKKVCNSHCEFITSALLKQHCSTDRGKEEVLSCDTVILWFLVRFPHALPCQCAFSSCPSLSCCTSACSLSLWPWLSLSSSSCVSACPCSSWFMSWAICQWSSLDCRHTEKGGVAHWLEANRIVAWNTSLLCRVSVCASSASSSSAHLLVLLPVASCSAVNTKGAH